MPASALPRRTPAALLAAARAGLREAAASPEAADRYARSHLAALRAASAMLATRARPIGRSGERAARRGRSRSVWTLLALVAPELAEWGAFFAAGAAKRAAAESGITHAVTAREADDLLRDAQIFLGLVEAALAADAGALFGDPRAAALDRSVG